jgi:hypothetical protein
MLQKHPSPTASPYCVAFFDASDSTEKAVGAKEERGGGSESCGGAGGNGDLHEGGWEWRRWETDPVEVCRTPPAALTTHRSQFIVAAGFRSSPCHKPRHLHCQLASPHSATPRCSSYLAPASRKGEERPLPLATTCQAMGGTNRVDIPRVGAEEGVAWMRLSLVHVTALSLFSVNRLGHCIS